MREVKARREEMNQEEALVVLPPFVRTFFPNHQDEQISILIRIITDRDDWQPSVSTYTKFRVELFKAQQYHDAQVALEAQAQQAPVQPEQAQAQEAPV